MKHVERQDPGRNRRYCECGNPWPCVENFVILREGQPVPGERP
jgi:hypothetical protein